MLLLEDRRSQLGVHQERLCLEHVERHVLLHHVKLLGQHLNRNLHRGDQLKLLLLELLLLFHSHHNRMRGLLNLSLDHDDAGL